MRINLRLSGTAENLILELADSISASPKDIVLDSLALYQLAVKEIQKGGRLGIRDKNGEFTAIATPTLTSIASADNAVTPNNTAGAF